MRWKTLRFDLASLQTWGILIFILCMMVLHFIPPLNYQNLFSFQNSRVTERTQKSHLTSQYLLQKKLIEPLFSSLHFWIITACHRGKIHRGQLIKIAQRSLWFCFASCSDLLLEDNSYCLSIWRESHIIELWLLYDIKFCVLKQKASLRVHFTFIFRDLKTTVSTQAIHYNLQANQCTTKTK